MLHNLCILSVCYIQRSAADIGSMSIVRLHVQIVLHWPKVGVLGLDYVNNPTNGPKNGYTWMADKIDIQALHCLMDLFQNSCFLCSYIPVS
jgi:hypothetical protein